jgi:hypothetical protein
LNGFRRLAADAFDRGDVLAGYGRERRDARPIIAAPAIKKSGKQHGPPVWRRRARDLFKGPRIASLDKRLQNMLRVPALLARDHSALTVIFFSAF